MEYPLFIVTGAPGAGKSTALEAFIGLGSDYIAFDIDWLAISASNLCGKDIFTDSSTWPPYNQLWFEVLHSVYRNGIIPVLFAPLDLRDIQNNVLPEWVREVKWALLDCDDETRRRRLTERANWDDTMIDHALDDARFLRQTVQYQINTALMNPLAVAENILEWLEESTREILQSNGHS
jgi:hypothetical protein